MIGQFSAHYEDPRMYELDALIRAMPPEPNVYRGGCKRGSKPGEKHDGSKKRAELDRVAAEMRAKHAPRRTRRRVYESAAEKMRAYRMRKSATKLDGGKEAA